MEKGEQVEPMSCEKVPSEVMEDILSRLPVKSLMRFRCVCKSWNSLVNNPRFIKTHLSRTTIITHPTLILSYPERRFYCLEDFNACHKAFRLRFPFDSPFTHFDKVGCCNGLLCFSDGNTRYNKEPSGNLYIWNPTTGEYKKLPPVPRTPRRLGPPSYSCSGFGYNAITDEYKVVVVSFSINERNGLSSSDVHVYTLGTDQWRRLGDFQGKFVESTTEVYYSAFVNGCLHWCSEVGVGGYEQSIVSFDLEDEEFRELPPPDLGPWDYKKILKLGELGGCLSYSHFMYNVEIWVMKDYGVRESWTKQFVITLPNSRVLVEYFRFNDVEALGVWKTGEIVLNHKNALLLLYDPKSGKVRDHMIHGFPQMFACLSTKSLVSLRF